MMMYVFAAIVGAMMLLCVAAAAGLFPNAWSRKMTERLWKRKELQFLRQLRECLHSVA